MSRCSLWSHWNCPCHIVGNSGLRISSKHFILCPGLSVTQWPSPPGPFFLIFCHSIKQRINLALSFLLSRIPPRPDESCSTHTIIPDAHWLLSHIVRTGLGNLVVSPQSECSGAGPESPASQQPCPYYRTLCQRSPIPDGISLLSFCHVQFNLL